MARKLHIAVVEKSDERAQTISNGLRDAGDFEITIVNDSIGLSRKLAEMAPDVVLIALDDPSRDTLEDLTAASSPNQRPVAMFVDKSDSATMRAAINAGVSAYVVDGLRQDRIKPILEAAIARFHNFSRLRAELTATKAALTERKTIDRAKGLLMKARGISEEEAYALLRKSAMDQGKRLADVAESLVTAAGLLS